MSANSLSIATSFDDAETTCSAMPYGSGSAFGRRYGLQSWVIRLGKSKVGGHILVANFAKLHQKVHELFPLCQELVSNKHVSEKL
jgi:hypothetical protein